MSVRILTGDCRDILKTLPDESVHCVVTSPPYWGLRNYGTGQWLNGKADCQHEGSDRYYTEQSAALANGSAEAFSKPGPENAARLKAARWREAGSCIKCNAVFVDNQLGLERSLGEHVDVMTEVFRDVRRVLRKDGTLWLNYGDSYNNRTKVRETSHQPALNGFVDDNWAERAARGGVRMSISEDGLKEKDLCGIPWRVAFALQADGWYLRQDIIWSKPNPMPESVRDRCTKAHEYLFLLSKSERYYYDADAIREPAQDRPFDPELKTIHPNNTEWHDNRYAAGASGYGNNPNGRNKRSVWEIATAPYSEAHFATFPPALIEPCIKAGCPPLGTVLDPFGGAGTTGLVADRLQRNAILIELNPEYAAMARRRIDGDAPLFADTYDSADDVEKSFKAAYDAINERKANGGPGWVPK